MRRQRHSKKQRGIMKAGVIAGAMLVFVNVNAAPMSAQDSPIKTGRLQNQTSVSGENVTNVNNKVNSLTNFGYEQLTTELNEKIEQQRKDILLNGDAVSAVQICNQFFSAADFETLGLPKVQALEGANLYVSADPSSAVIHTFDGSDSVTLLYQCEDSNFYFVEYNGLYRGYMEASGLNLSILSAAQIQQASEINRCRFAATANQELYLWTDASEDGQVAALIEGGVIMTVIGSQNGWLQVSVAGATGYVKAEEVTIERMLTAEVDDEGYISSVRAELELQKQLEEEQKRLEEEQAKQDEEPAAGESAENGDASASDDQTGGEPAGQEPSYKEPSYEEPSYEEPSEPETETNQGGESVVAPSGIGQAIANTALSYLGVPYVYGGASPSGFDCSGLVYYSAMLNGISVPRTADAQYYANGTHVSFDELQSGDLVFFSADWSSEIEHVGIYIGGGQFVHAPHTGDVVKISTLTDYYSRNYWGALRLG